MTPVSAIPTDVLLIQPPIRDFYRTAKRTIPYGLACIASALRNAGFSVQLFDALATPKSRAVALPPQMQYLAAYYGRADISPFSLFHTYRHYGYSYEHLARVAAASGAWLVGISSLFTPYADEAFETARVVRLALPAARIVLGGHHPTALPRAAMACDAVDYAIRGEGEEALPMLAQTLKTGVSPAHVPGLVYRTASGALQINPPAVMADLNKAPRPALDLIHHRFYARAKQPSTVVVTSRGCPMRCSYCALGNHRMYPHRQRSVASVLAEIDAAVSLHGVRFIDFEDENLSLHKPWFLRLLAALAHRYSGHDLTLRAMNGLYPPTLDETVVPAMKAAGFKMLNLSLGSTCQRQLERFRRPDVRPAFDGALRLAAEYGLEAVGYIIAGAPGQTADTSLDDLLYLAGKRVLAGLSIYYPAPGSRDYEELEARNVLPASPLLFRSSALPIHQGTSRQASATLLRISRIVNFIKQLIDNGENLPLPAPFSTNFPLDLSDKFALGRVLLSHFMATGEILGIENDGGTYAHRVDASLTERCRHSFRNIKWHGVRRWGGGISPQHI